MLGASSFALVVAFGRSSGSLRVMWLWCFNLLLVALLPSFVSYLNDHVFKLVISAKVVGFFLCHLQSFSCELFKLSVYLWGSGGLIRCQEYKQFLTKEKLS